jgi:ppGpp synthetase/RelA/SpoT-type nucleotidyltranferase
MKRCPVVHPPPELLRQVLPAEIQSDEGFARWFEPWRELIMVAVTEVHEAVSYRLDEERRRVYQKEGIFRSVWQVTGTDGRSLLKSAASVRSKLGRQLRAMQEEGKLLGGRMSRDQVEHLLLGFPDLGRFRVVCDYPCDVVRARRVLLGGKPLVLLGRYPIEREIKDFSRDLSLLRLARGHRGVQLAVRVPGKGRDLLVEIQLMTLLENAWDCRNHPIYEWTRDGGALPDDLALKDINVSNSLQLLDDVADQVHRAFIRERKKCGGTR